MTLSDTSVKQNFNSIDLFKLIMAVLVVAAHTHPLENCTNQTILTAYGQFTQMTVLFFFLSSGYLLAAKISSVSDTAQKVKITFRHLCKIAKMYLVWSIAYLPLAIFAYRRDGMSFLRSVLDYVRGFVFIGEHYNSWHLWYLLSTIYALLLVIVMLRLRFTAKKWLIVSICAGLLSIVMTEIAACQTPLPAPVHHARTLISMTTTSGRILEGAFFIPIGMLLRNRNLSLRSCLILYAGCFCAYFFVENSAVRSILFFLSAIAFFGILLHIDLKDHPVYIIFRKLSTDIYLIHMYIWTFYYSLIYKEVHFGWDSFLVTTLISLTAGLLHLHIGKKKKLAAH